AMKNGPWQFDFQAVLLREYDDKLSPVEIDFSSMDIWVHVLKPTLGMMNKDWGERIGRWIGLKVVAVDVDKDGMAWGEYLRIRVTIPIDEPLLRGIRIRSSPADEDGHWFDIKYEKVPHFCFHCGLIQHAQGGCQGDPSAEVQQWGEWLR